jgi:hypothetical protein
VEGTTLAKHATARPAFQSWIKNEKVTPLKFFSILWAKAQNRNRNAKSMSKPHESMPTEIVR